MPFTPLQPGDKVALVCTGSICELVSEPEACKHYLAEHYGLNAEYDQHTFRSTLPSRRAEIFLSYLQDDSIKAIWSVRGGEGTADIIPFLEANARSIKVLKPKPLIGFSDFTAVLVYFNQRFDWPVMHAIGVRQMHRRSVDQMSELLTLDWLMDGKKVLKIRGLNPLNRAAVAPGALTGEMIGGNLSLIQISIQDIWELKAAGKIVLLEEVGEKPYRVARTLKYLQRINFFAGAKAIILAGFDFPDLTKFESQMMDRSMQEILTRFARDCHCPVLFSEVIGHGKVNYPVPFYVPATLTLGSAAELVIR